MPLPVVVLATVLTTLWGDQKLTTGRQEDGASTSWDTRTLTCGTHGLNALLSSQALFAVIASGLLYRFPP